MQLAPKLKPLQCEGNYNDHFETMQFSTWKLWILALLSMLIWHILRNLGIYNIHGWNRGPILSDLMLMSGTGNCQRSPVHERLHLFYFFGGGGTCMGPTQHSATVFSFVAHWCACVCWCHIWACIPVCLYLLVQQPLGVNNHWNKL